MAHLLEDGQKAIVRVLTDSVGVVTARARGSNASRCWCMVKGVQAAGGAWSRECKPLVVHGLACDEGAVKGSCTEGAVKGI